ncbi:uncharacterized protein LOC142830906 [Pelodiscus sinensis]|uniref:uncharacterized protein LOC142830906 n=1 Tax=Pelodiscus sinensis TaxID=13735 RepID=UPI003F6DA3E4
MARGGCCACTVRLTTATKSLRSALGRARHLEWSTHGDTSLRTIVTTQDFASPLHLWTEQYKMEQFNKGEHNNDHCYSCHHHPVCHTGARSVTEKSMLLDFIIALILEIMKRDVMRKVCNFLMHEEKSMLRILPNVFLYYLSVLEDRLVFFFCNGKAVKSNSSKATRCHGRMSLTSVQDQTPLNVQVESLSSGTF